MAEIEYVVQTLQMAIGRLERASVELEHVNAIQAARADLERVVTALHGQRSVYVENIVSLLCAVAKDLQAINHPEVNAATVGTSEAVIMLERSIRDSHP